MRLVFSAILVLGLASAEATPPDLRACAGESGTARARCLDGWAASTELDWRTWRDVDELLGADPAGVVEALDRVARKRGDLLDPAPGVAARVHDVRGRALEALGRSTEAADAYLEGLGLDDGVVRLLWIGARGTEDRVDEIDPGAGRLEAAARALAASGRRDEARPLLRRALELGAGGASRRLWSEIGGGAPSPYAGESTVLSAARWFPALPEFELERLDGGHSRVPETGPKVLLLDFWASWCVPCADELPRLQALYQAERDRGLELLAVNVGEPVETVRAFAEALGLRLPLALYGPEAERVLDVRSLPTLVVVDRLGRIRRRWNGYRQGLQDELTALVEELLDDGRAVPTDDLGEVLLGAGRLEPLFSQLFPSHIDGLAPVAAGEVEPEARMLLVAARSLAVLDTNGAVLRRHEVGPAAGALRKADLDGDGTPELYTFRRGATRLLRLDPETGASEEWESPAPVLDVQAGPSGDGVARQLLVGTTVGLFQGRVSGPPFQLVEPIRSEVLDLWTAPAATLVLESRRLTRIAIDSTVVDRRELNFDGRRLLAGGGAEPAAVAGEGVTAAVAGRFLSDGTSQFAVATASGQLLLFDAASGRPVFRARWPGIEILAVADVDRDGRDDLLIAAGTRLSALRGRR